MKEHYATIDLGSNSFHMLTAALEHDEIRIIESISEKVMLADGMTKQHGITEQAQARGLECIARFAQRIASIPVENIRIVGTNTLRAAINAEEYVLQIEKILGGLPVNVISGIEEARLIYLGVNHTWSSIHRDTRHLVVDIGGGSTEFITGKSFKIKRAESLRMGCVSYRRFFPGEVISEEHFKNAVNAAKLELASIKKDYSNKAWSCVIGSAGTFKAIESLLVENGYCEEGISFDGLKKLKKRLMTFSDFASINLPGLKTLREKTLIPGLAIAWAIFQSLKIQQLYISPGGLREGVLYDLLGRLKAEDIRERSILALRKRYHVPEFRSKLYQKISLELLNNLKLERIEIGDEHRRYLDWAVQTCRIGLTISHSQYQNHSAYLVRHSELSGFTIKERMILSSLLKNQRRKFCKESIEELHFNSDQTLRFLVLLFLLRLTCLIGQNGKMNNCHHLSLKAKPEGFEIGLDQGWFIKHPMLKRTISLEVNYWQSLGIQLTLSNRRLN